MAALPFSAAASGVPIAAQPLVDLGVDPGDEERRDRRDRGDVVPVGRRLLEPGHVRVDDLAVALEREDQRHVDRDPLGQRRGDGGDALGRGRDLDVHVRPVDQPPQLLGLGDRRLGLAREPRVDLERDPPVDAVGGVVDGPQHVGRPADVIGGDHPRRLFDRDLADRQVLDLRLVGVALGEGVGEDRRVRRHAANLEVLDQAGQVAGVEPVPADVVEPDGYAGCRDFLEHVAHVTASFLVCKASMGLRVRGATLAPWRWTTSRRRRPPRP